METKCPLEDPTQCPERELYHFGINNVQIESAKRIEYIQKLKDRLVVAIAEINDIIDEMKIITGELKRKE
jgi:hypothetical protein